MGSFEHSTRIQWLLNQLRDGDPAARAELLGHAESQLRALARRMFHRRPDLRALEQTDDVLQKALLRLHRALASIQPPTVRAFFGLAATNIRWVLADLARELAGQVVRYAGDLACDGHSIQARCWSAADEPSTLTEWTEFHVRVEELPEEERAIVDLLWYEGLTQAEAAHVLGVSLRTVKRRWLAARTLLGQALQGSAPGDP